MPTTWELRRRRRGQAIRMRELSKTAEEEDRGLRCALTISNAVLPRSEEFLTRPERMRGDNV